VIDRLHKINVIFPLLKYILFGKKKQKQREPENTPCLSFLEESWIILSL